MHRLGQPRLDRGRVDVARDAPAREQVVDTRAPACVTASNGPAAESTWWTRTRLAAVALELGDPALELLEPRQHADVEARLLRLELVRVLAQQPQQQALERR